MEGQLEESRRKLDAKEKMLEQQAAAAEELIEKAKTAAVERPKESPEQRNLLLVEDTPRVRRVLDLINAEYVGEEVKP